MPTTRTMVWVTTSFIGYHRWRDAPEPVAFLRDFHRHVFHVKVMVEVTHDDRQIEFIMLKRELDNYLEENLAERQFDLSCEQIALILLREYKANMVEVSEDGENGARVIQYGQ